MAHSLLPLRLVALCDEAPLASAHNVLLLGPPNGLAGLRWQPHIALSILRMLPPATPVLCPVALPWLSLP